MDSSHMFAPWNIVFPSVPLGNYILIIHLPEQDVIIEQITIA